MTKDGSINSWKKSCQRTRSPSVMSCSPAVCQPGHWVSLWYLLVKATEEPCRLQTSSGDCVYYWCVSTRSGAGRLHREAAWTNTLRRISKDRNGQNKNEVLQSTCLNYKSQSKYYSQSPRGPGIRTGTTAGTTHPPDWQPAVSTTVSVETAAQIGPPRDETSIEP